jgi:hypothetical protein
VSLFGSESALRQLQARIVGAAPQTVDVEPVSVSSDDGRVTVSVEKGEVSEIEIDARAMRNLTNAELADVLVDLVNRGLRSSRPDQAEASSFPDLLSAVAAIADEAEASFGRQMAALDEALAQVERVAEDDQAARG